MLAVFKMCTCTRIQYINIFSPHSILDGVTALLEFLLLSKP